jgi:hypothetical protein
MQFFYSSLQKVFLPLILNIIILNATGKAEKDLKCVIEAAFCSRQTRKNANIIRAHSKNGISALG